MVPYRKLFARIRALFFKRTLDAEMDEEMRAHIELRTEANIAAGMNPEEARFAALRQFGWVESIKEECRDQRGVSRLETLSRDVRYALRQLRKNPGFTVAAVLMLALGIGANTVVFSVAKAVLLRPLGFEEAERLAWIRLLNTQNGTVEDSISWPEIEDIRESTRSFESVATFGFGAPIWEQGDRAEEVPALWATPELAQTLRIRPVLGRLFDSSDAEESAAPVALISYELWQGQFGGARDIIGRTLRVDEKSQTVVGVLPPQLQFPPERGPSTENGSGGRSGLQGFWFPMKVQGSDRTSRGARMFLTIGRLKPSITEEAARAELQVLGERLAADFPETNRGKSFDLITYRDQILGRTQQGIPILGVAVVAVLIICCVNLANLLLARGVRQQHELAIRLALGASRWRIIRSLLTESVLISLLGGGLGIGLAEIGLRSIRMLASTNVPFIREAGLDSAALVFTAGLSLATALVFGLVPALLQSRVEAAESLRSGKRSTSGSQIRIWERGLLVGQIAAVVVLLSSAGLLLESFRRLMGQDFGYKPESVVALDLSVWDFKTNEEVCRLYRDIRARLAALPGVQAVGTSSSAPLTGKWTITEKAQVAGQFVPEADRPSLAATFVAFDYFQAMGIRLIDGRFFQDSELKDDGPGQNVIINRAAAAALFPGRPAVGGRFAVGSNSDRMLEVVGVVEDTRDVRVEEAPLPRFYWHYAFGGAQVMIRSAVPHQALIPLVREVVQKTDSRILRQTFQPMSEIVSTTVAERKFLMVMVTAYAALALGVAAIGIFGVVAYQIAQRRNEFGIRLALGATAGNLLRLVLARVGLLTGIGVGIGLAASFATNRFLATQLFALSPHDPLLLAVVSAVIFVVALAASFIPARQAARTDPMEALRDE
jgi:predicted permease